MRIDVGIGEFMHSTDASAELKTYALGSCVALVVTSTSPARAAMVHIALPDSLVNPAKAAILPGYFADTGVPMLMEWIDRCAGGRRRDFTYHLYGGASILDENNHFDIGRRNALAVKRLLWRYGCGMTREDVGGNVSRTVSVAVGSGCVQIRYGVKQASER
jgi:chemotaxis protein CheD